MTRKSTKGTKSPRRRYPAPDHHQPQTEPAHTPWHDAAIVEVGAKTRINGRLFEVVGVDLFLRIGVPNSPTRAEVLLNEVVDDG